MLTMTLYDCPATLIKCCYIDEANEGVFENKVLTKRPYQMYINYLVKNYCIKKKFKVNVHCIGHAYIITSENMIHVHV